MSVSIFNRRVHLYPIVGQLCGMGVENVTHIINVCGMLSQKEYKLQHYKLASHLKLVLMLKWASLQKVIKNDQVKILWNFDIKTDRILEAIKPDITVVDKERQLPHRCGCLW